MNLNLLPIEEPIPHPGGLLTRRRVAGLALALLTAAQGTSEADAGRKKKKRKRKGKSQEKVRICHKGQTISVTPSEVQEHLAHGDFRGECPTDPDPDPTDPDPKLPDPICPGFPSYTPGQATVAGPQCTGGSSGTIGGGYTIHRVAQTFVVLSDGGIVSASVTLVNAFTYQVPPNTDYTIDIRPVDQAGTPLGDAAILVSTTVNTGSNPGYPFVLTGMFDCPVPVQAGTMYALAITTAVPFNLQLQGGNNASAEQLFSDTDADGTFVGGGSFDLRFSTRMVV